MNCKTRFESFFVVIVYFPSSSVDAPVEVPFTITVTPGNGSSFSSVTFPFTVMVWAVERKLQAKTRIKTGSICLMSSAVSLLSKVVKYVYCTKYKKYFYFCSNNYTILNLSMLFIVQFTHKLQ